ncbi:MAG: D-alanyl-D-alanine carboxypeptidase family protein [Candidatus Gracilibacteria bacterium]|nr:D-alanyl-D-alanine carboxypeptidase family protein [Candidatus Gracilibacteria bacterium]
MTEINKFDSINNISTQPVDSQDSPEVQKTREMDLNNPEDLKELGIPTIEELQEIKVSTEVFNSWKEKPINHYDLENRGDISSPTAKYKEEHPKHPVKPSNEQMVNVSEYGIRGEDYYFKLANASLEQLIAKHGKENGEDFYEKNKMFRELKEEKLINPDCHLRKGVVARLKEVNRILKAHGYQIMVNNGYRNVFTQTEAKRTYENIYGTYEAKKHIAKPGTSTHQTGGSLDVKLLDKDGNIVNLKFGKEGTNTSLYGENLVDEKGWENLTDEEKEIIQMRRVLCHVMKLAGFIGNPKYFWDYGFGDSLSTYILSQRISKKTGEKTIVPAIYKIITNIENQSTTEK